LMGGQVAIDSEPGRGTTVRISVPFDAAADDLVQTLAAGRGLPTGLRQGSRRILVVDDNSTNVNYLLDLLKMAGFEGEGCASVDAALARHAQLPADLVITDLVMPGRDGFDLIRAIRGCTVQPDTPIIVASASAFPGDQVRSMAIGASAFLPKPVDGVALLQKMASLLEVDYLYRDDLKAPAPAVAQVDAQSAAARERLRSADARPLIAQLREAADIGQLMRVQSLIDGCSDAQLSEALHRLLDPALREQDAELVLSTLDSVGSPAS
ncbi:MAG: response regulator, partial [Rubrivivax sp.]